MEGNNSSMPQNVVKDIDTEVGHASVPVEQDLGIISATFQWLCTSEITHQRL